MPSPRADVLAIGGGPAGLRAAEVAAANGARVILCDGQRSVGRKLLVAGRGGLNLTHSEPVENFPARYRDYPERWKDLLGTFSPDDLRAWASGLGIETYVGSSGRIFPKGQKAAGLLRTWVKRLRASGVEFRMALSLRRLERVGDEWRADFSSHASDGQAETLALAARSVVLALGGASWPETGSDGAWPAILSALGVEIEPWKPANCGWEVDWPNELLARAEGLPLKNLTVSAGGEAVSGELLITRYGLEGGAIYRLGPILRAMERPEITLDLKPQLSADALRTRLASVKGDHLLGTIKLAPAATALMETYGAEDLREAEALVRRLKQFTIALTRPRPLAEAISCAGGIRWEELDETLMLRQLPGLFVAGEMVDWEAPTGGYLLQGCFATGTRAGQAAANWPARLATPS